MDVHTGGVVPTRLDVHVARGKLYGDLTAVGSGWDMKS